jgi:diketogulonate reductase-like aldo/keto reductase
MPLVALGTWSGSYHECAANDYSCVRSKAKAAVPAWLDLGGTHIDTANDYRNQDGVGRALQKVPRDSFYLTTKVPSQEHKIHAYSGTTVDLYENMKLLGLDYVDLVLIHFPPRGQSTAKSCPAIQEQWRAMEDFLKAGKTRTIGVSNYCPSTFECLLEKATVVPAVNQVQYHIGMGTDPIGLISYCKSKNITLQAYSPLGDGKGELITGELVTGIGKNHGKSGAQVSLRWVAQHGVPLSTKASNAKYLAEDLDIFDWKLSAAEMAKLDAATTPTGKPSFACDAVVEQA